MKNRPWLDLVNAVRAIREARGVSGGAACTLLCQACESGVVGSRKRPWPEQPDEPPEPIFDYWSPPIPIEDWHRASIDLSHGWLILAGDKPLRADVEINADDLRHRLGTEKVEMPKHAGKRGPKSVTLEATKTRMQDDVDNGTFSKMQLQDMKQEALARTYGVSRETACKARDAVLSAIDANSITDK